MVIVSQDKTMQFNYDNIEVIGIGNPLEDDDGKFKIIVSTISDNEYVIAKYTTEEKAKAILKSMRCFNAACKMYFYTGTAVQSTLAEKLLDNKLMPDIYEMPEE